MESNCRVRSHVWRTLELANDSHALAGTELPYEKLKGQDDMVTNSLCADVESGTAYLQLFQLIAIVNTISGDMLLGERIDATMQSHNVD